MSNKDFPPFLINEISKHEPLTRQEEQELAKIIQNPETSPEERIKFCNKLAMANMKFAIAVIKAYEISGLNIDRADLFQHAFEGLLDAARKFEPGYGKFCTYARDWILARVGPALKNSMYCVKTGSGTKRKVELVLDIANRLSHEEMRTISPLAVANTCQMNLNEINTALHATTYTPLDDIQLSSYDIVTLRDELEELKDEIRSSTNESDYDIIARYFGLDGIRPQTSLEIAGHYCISGQRVRVIIENTIKALSETMGREPYGGDEQD